MSIDVRLVWRKLKDNAMKEWSHTIANLIKNIISEQGWDLKREERGFLKRKPMYRGSEQILISFLFEKKDFVFSLWVYSFDGIRAHLYKRDPQNLAELHKVVEFSNDHIKRNWFWKKVYTIEKFEELFSKVNTYVDAN